MNIFVTRPNPSGKKIVQRIRSLGKNDFSCETD